jgi:hypothetical protein
MSRRSRIRMVALLALAVIVASVALLPSQGPHVENVSLHSRATSWTRRVGRYCDAPGSGVEGAMPVAGAKLLYVALLFRHGDRSSIHALPNVRGEETSWSCRLKPAESAALRASAARIEVRAARGGARLTRDFESILASDAAAAAARACAPGQLTARGVAQHTSLGAHLRAAYAGRGVLDGEIYARSTDYRRTLISAAALLSTLLPAPRTVHLEVEEDEAQETMLGIGAKRTSKSISERSGDALGGEQLVAGRCARADRLQAEERAAFSLRSARGAEEGGGGAVALRAVAARFGSSVRRKSVVDVTDALFAAACHGTQLPCAARARPRAGAQRRERGQSVRGADPSAGRCVDAPLAARLAAASDAEYCSRFAGADGGAESTRLSWQPFLAALWRNARRAMVAGSGTVGGAALYSGHDTVIAPVLGALGLSALCGWPPYAARIAIEVWRLPPRSEPGPGPGPEPEHELEYELDYDHEHERAAASAASSIAAAAESSGSPYLHRHAVRVLYNGRVVSDRIPACRGAALCPAARVDALLRNLTAGHATIEAACA